MIELEHAHKRFRVSPGLGRNTRTVEALRSVTLSVPAGTALGVVGPNGAGKSTLFGLVLGFLKPSSGLVAVEGLVPRDYVRRHGAGYLPERFSLPAQWPVGSALEGLARLEGIERPAARAGELLERLGLTGHSDKPVGALSRGLLQRLGIAQALLARRALVVLDEPTEGLDPIWRLELRQLIAELRANGCTLLIASHELNEVERFVDLAVLMEDGAVRETIVITPDGLAARRYEIRLRGAAQAALDFFPDAALTTAGLLVTVRDAAELSARLAALLESGAIVEAVLPADGLEQRVRAALDTNS